MGKGELEMGFAGQTPHLTVTMFYQYAACPVEGLRTCLERQGRGREDTYTVKLHLQAYLKRRMYTRFTDTRTVEARSYKHRKRGPSMRAQTFAQHTPDLRLSLHVTTRAFFIYHIRGVTLVGGNTNTADALHSRGDGIYLISAGRGRTTATLR